MKKESKEEIMEETILLVSAVSAKKLLLIK